MTNKFSPQSEDLLDSDRTICCCSFFWACATRTHLSISNNSDNNNNNNNPNLNDDRIFFRGFVARAAETFHCKGEVAAEKMMTKGRLTLGQ